MCFNYLYDQFYSSLYPWSVLFTWPDLFNFFHSQFISIYFCCQSYFNTFNSFHGQFVIVVEKYSYPRNILMAAQKSAVALIWRVCYKCWRHDDQCFQKTCTLCRPNAPVDGVKPAKEVLPLPQHSTRYVRLSCKHWGYMSVLIPNS